MANRDGIRAEDAAIFGYGLLLPRADGSIRAAVLRQLDAHRAAADAARVLWPDAPASPAGYDLTMPLGNARDALLLAIRLESDCCEGWRSQLEAADKDRAAQVVFAMDTLTAAATQLARWRTLVPGAPFEALPGFPASG